MRTADGGLQDGRALKEFEVFESVQPSHVSVERADWRQAAGPEQGRIKSALAVREQMA